MTTLTADLHTYLEECGGQDTLVFQTSEQATEAARALRQQVDTKIIVQASYDKVVIRLQD